MNDLTTPSTDAEMQVSLDEVRGLMAETLEATTLGEVIRSSRSILTKGKMLRSRMAFRVGPKAGVSHETLVYSASAVELIHTASLLHDDVIDGGVLRRGAPTFWVERGVTGAILVGDMMLFKALDLICQVENGALTHELVKMTGDLCEAEAEQDILLQGAPSQLEYCVRIARRKTGALFAFIGYACAGSDEALRPVLKEAGYAIGTAYQMADDLLDAYGDAEAAGKTLGTDKDREIVSVAELTDNPLDYLYGLCHQAVDSLEAWPAVAEGIKVYLNQDVYPALDKLTEGLRGVWERPPAQA